MDVTLNLAGNVFKIKRVLYTVMMVACFIAVTVFDVSAMAVILTCLVIGIADAAFAWKREAA